MCQAGSGCGAATPPGASGTPSGGREAHIISKIITAIITVFVPPRIMEIWIDEPYFFTLAAWITILGVIPAIWAKPLREMRACLATFAERFAYGLARLSIGLVVRFVRWVGSLIPPTRSLVTRILRIFIALTLLAVVTLLYNLWVLLMLPAPDFDFRECVRLGLPVPSGGDVLQFSVATDQSEFYSVRLTSRYWQDDEERLYSRTLSPGHGYTLISLRKRDDHQGEDRDGEIEIGFHWRPAWVPFPNVVVRRDALRYVIEKGEAERAASRPGEAGRKGA